MALLLFVLLSLQQRNTEIEVTSNVGRNMQQCNEISETIANMYNNRAASQQVLFVERAAAIKKVSGAGAVLVGETSCRYVGTVEGDEGGGKSLEAGKSYLFKKENGEVSICEVGPEC